MCAVLVTHGGIALDVAERDAPERYPFEGES